MSLIRKHVAVLQAWACLDLVVIKESSVAVHMWVRTPFKTRDFWYCRPNLARERLQIDTDLRVIMTSTADELSGGTNIDDLERPWTHEIRVLVNFREFQAATHTLRVNVCRNYCRYKPRQPAYDAVARLMSIKAYDPSNWNEWMTEQLI